jgi:ATP-binding cassette subfamily B protein
MLVAAVLMLHYDARLFLVVLAMAPILWLINRHFRGRLSRAYRDVQESFSRVTATVAESVRGIRVTQGFARQDLNADLFHELVADHSEYSVRVTQTEAVFLPVMELNSQFFLAALILLGGYCVLVTGSTPMGSLIQFFLLSGSVFGPIQKLASMYSQALSAMAGAERVFGFLDSEPERLDASGAVAIPELRGKVEFRDVSFAYTPERPVLHHLSFTINPGEMVALVGTTGSGKTTTINLVAKFCVPQSGEIRVDDRDLATIEGRSLRRHLGIVLQQNFLFTGTVLENILVGRPEASEEAVREAARRLDCLDLLEGLPEGLRTRVGEQGVGLSAGQRQLVCFTRAMLADPRILILDEATSAVDAISEARLQRALGVLLTGRTSLVVAHRLSTIRHAHQVLVLEQGRLLEQGTHRQLLRLGGRYARLYRQFMLGQEFT